MTRVDERKRRLRHDHDWEIALLLQALEQDPFFVGAMGSRRTHAERRRRLIEAGGDPPLVDRVVGPVGLIEATRDPESLAVSILAQVVQTYDEHLERRPASGRNTGKDDEPHSTLR